MVKKFRSTAALSSEEIQKREFYWAKEYGTRNFGIGVQCEKCSKLRMAYEWSEEKDVPEYVDCSMIVINGEKGSCDIPSHLTQDSEEFSEGRFVAGDVVLAKYHRYPWWPAIITDNVTNSEHHFVYERNGSYFYHMEFFHPKRTSRAIIEEKFIRPYNGEDYSLRRVKNVYKENLEKSLEVARKSLQVPQKIRVYWMLKYIKYRKNKKHSINVDEIPMSVSVDEDLAVDFSTSNFSHNGSGIGQDNHLSMPENVHPGAEGDFTAPLYNGNNMHEDVMQHETCLDGPAVAKDNSLPMSDNMHAGVEGDHDHMHEDVMQHETCLDGSDVDKDDHQQCTEYMLTQTRNNLEEGVRSLTNPGVSPEDDRLNQEASKITKDGDQNGNVQPEEFHRTNIELIFLNCIKQKEPGDEKFILQSDLNENCKKFNHRYKMYQYCRMNL